MEVYSKRKVTTNVTVREDVLQKFRVAVAKKHNGVLRGNVFDEFNNALDAWTRFMNGEANFVSIKSRAQTPVFGEER